MKKRVEFLLEGDVATGGVRTTTNFFESSDFISGAVLRAGFAWNILFECPYADEAINEKLNFVSYRDKEKCTGCPNAEACKKFGKMRFSYLYPLNAVPAPFTLHKCKAHADHCVMDTVAVNGKLACTECKGRMESVKGYVNSLTGTEIKVPKSLTVHTAIDINTGTALDGSLYSVYAIRHGQTFYGYIDDCDTDMIKKGDTVRVGKLSSCGFGKLKIIDVKDCSESGSTEKIKSSVSEFNNNFKSKISTDNRGKEYASILFTSDAVLGLEKEKNEVLLSDRYKEIWQKHLFGDETVLSVEKVFAQNFSYSGFDTSIKTDEDIKRRKSPVIMTKRGTSILVSFKTEDKESAVSELCRMSDNGIGRDTEIGCGSVEICCLLHCLGIMEDKND